MTPLCVTIGLGDKKIIILEYKYDYVLTQILIFWMRQNMIQTSVDKIF